MDNENVIDNLSIAKLILCEPQMLNPDMCIRIGQAINDAIALLEGQRAVKPKSKVRHGANAQIQHFCGNCNTMLHGKPKFCSECGKAVKWDGSYRKTLV